MRWPLLAAALLSPILLQASPSQAAKPQLADRIVAVVDREPILLSELAARAAPLALQMRAQAKSTADAAKVKAKVYQQTLDAMIDERLIAHHAAEKGIRVAKDETDRALESVAHQNGMTPSELFDAVNKQMNMSAEEYVAALSQTILKYKVVRLEIEDVPADDDAMAALMARTEKTLLKRLRKNHFWSVRVRFE
jgi:peptidyl-prolyl cis-trans isomerase SurA